MTSTRFRHKVVLLLLSLVLALPWTASAGFRLENPQPVALSAFLDDLLNRVKNFLTSGGPSKEGCYIDPNGRCVPRIPEPQPTNQTDSGCYIDPDGRCSS